MAQSPFSFLNDLAARGPAALQAPPWMVDEVQQRLVLLLNHVLMKEPQATARLARVAGRTLSFSWRQFSIGLTVTPAGLLDRVADLPSPDLSLTLTDESPLTLARAVLAGDKPAVRIEGDVMLAAEVNWLVDHVRWDIEDDLARLLGDAPARALVQGVLTLRQALQGATRRPGDAGP